LIERKIESMKISHLIGALCLVFAVQGVAQTATVKSDVWGKSPPASDDRFSNPKSKLYAGPDGYFDTGELRATSGATSYKFQGTFRMINGNPVAVKDLEKLFFNFGSKEQPKPGVYKIAARGNAAQMMVRLSFSAVANQQIKEWRSVDGAGTLTVSLVNGFVYFTMRDVKLEPQDTISQGGDWKKPMTLGFEGAMKVE
jgi:hypothetical protein